MKWTLVSRGDRVANSLITVDMIEEGWSGCFGSYQKTVKRHQPPGYSCQNVSEGHEQNELVHAVGERWNAQDNWFRASSISFSHQRNVSFKSFQIFTIRPVAHCLFIPLSLVALLSPRCLHMGRQCIGAEEENRLWRTVSIVTITEI